MIDETVKTLLAIRIWATESAVSSEGPDEIRIIMIGKTAMSVDTMSMTLPITTPFREIRFIFRAAPPNDAPILIVRTMPGLRKRREGPHRVT
jgi:hypothetical protein